MKKGFTLAEIMIALVVIGVITSILLPVAFNNVPNENVMKFKKGNATLAKVINELVTSGEYYKEGDLGIKADGSFADNSGDFCKNFSDIVTYKKTRCNNDITDYTMVGGIVALHWEKTAAILALANDNNSSLNFIDRICKESSTKNINYVQTSDSIYFFDPYPGLTFGANLPDGTINRNSCKQSNKDQIRNWLDCITDCSKTDYGMTKESCIYDGVLSSYKTFCMDIDGINKGEDPFGYGIRVDGKIILGKRAQEWLGKNIQEK